MLVIGKSKFIIRPESSFMKISCFTQSFREEKLCNLEYVYERKNEPAFSQIYLIKDLIGTQHKHLVQKNCCYD